MVTDSTQPSGMLGDLTRARPARTARATELVMAMTSNDVPAAYRIGTPRASTRAGTTRKPPPTPRNPVSSPTAVAVTSTFRARGH